MVIGVCFFQYAMVIDSGASDEFLAHVVVRITIEEGSRIVRTSIHNVYFVL